MSDIELIDSHCHLIFENFEKDLQDLSQNFQILNDSASLGVLYRS